MSVAGYLAPNRPESGILEKREQLRKQSVEAMKVGPLNGEILPGGVKRAGHQDDFDKGVEDYDAVLRSHCRLP
jgi:hypothetical protein